MNIAYICKEFGPVTGGGIGTYIYNVCMAMNHKGHRVFLVTDCFNSDNLNLLPKGIELVRVQPTRKNRLGSFISASHEYSYRAYDTLSALCSQFSIDIAEFAEFGGEGFATVRAKRLLGEFAGTKIIIKLHTPSSLLYTINEDRRLHVDSLCDYFMEDYCVKYADMVTSPSLSLGHYFEKRVGRTDIRQCPYPMELPEKGSPRTFTEKQIRRVRLIGSVQVRKGIDTFIKAAERVLRKDPEFLFEIWGADRNAHIFGRTLTEISQKQIPEDLRDRIVFKGGIPYSEIPELFMDSCFCVYPSRWENWANVCLEAMSYGCVVLASKEGGMSEMVEHGRSGFVIDPLDSADISSIILQHYTQPDLLAEISRNAHDRSNAICDPVKTASRIEENYKMPYAVKKWERLGGSPPLVSVVIPYYNQPRYLEQTIQSVRASDYPEVEILVVNDGSTTQKARAVFDDLTGVVKISKENGGLSSARNAGIFAAKGDFIIPLDADDLIRPDYIRKGVEALRNNPELGYISCHAQNFGEITNAYIPVGFVPEMMPYSNTHGKCVNLYRKKVFKSCGGYDEVMTAYEDWDFLLTLDECGVQGDVIPDEMFDYRRHFDSMVYSTANRQRADLIQYMMIKHEEALAPHAPKMAIMLARLWKQAEMRHEFAQQQIANAHFAPQSMRQLQVSAPARLQVYSAVNGQWWEHNSVYVDYAAGQWQTIRLNLPFAGRRGELRIDPSDLPGTVVIKEIMLRDKSLGRILFRAGGKNNFEGCEFSEQVSPAIKDDFLILACADEDPQILVSQPPGAGSYFLDISIYFTPEEDCDTTAIIDSYKGNSAKEQAKRFARRFLGTA